VFSALLLFVFLTLSACGASTVAQDAGGSDTREKTAPAKVEEPRKTTPETTAQEAAASPKDGDKAGKDSGSEKPDESDKSGTKVEAVLPEDILSKKELEKGAPESRDWNAPAREGYTPETASFFVTSDSSTGAIPAVKPFNFGNDPGGPEDKTLYLTIPKLGLTDVPVFDSVSEEKLTESAVHVPATGFPWQDGANVYIAGHRLGYPNTGSFRIFYDLVELANGDEVILRDSDGREYRYAITDESVVAPDNVEVMNPVEGKSVITLQTCTLPDYSERIVVRGELVG
jgi:sortase A